MKVESLHCYPVKSLRGLSLDALGLDERGPIDDRRWMVVDEANRFITQRQCQPMATVSTAVTDSALILSRAGATPLSVPRALSGPTLEVGVWRSTVEALDAGDDAAGWLTSALRRVCRLVAIAPDARRFINREYSPRPGVHTGFADAYPILIVTTGSLQALNATLDAPISIDRFRANVVLEHDTPFDEDTWGELRIGDLVFDAVKPCTRCTIINTDQHTGLRVEGPLKSLRGLHNAPGHGPVFGIYAVARSLGRVELGAAASVHSRDDRSGWGLPR